MVADDCVMSRVQVVDVQSVSYDFLCLWSGGRCGCSPDSGGRTECV